MPESRAIELFETYHLALFRFLRRMTGDPAAAEDLTQEVFLRALRRLPRHEERGRDASWLFRIARNLLIDRFRHSQRQPTLASIEHVQEPPRPAEHTLNLDLERALARLPHEEREAFLLREVGGLGYREISAATGATPDAVRSRIHRARCGLRTALSEGLRDPGAAHAPRYVHLEVRR